MTNITLKQLRYFDALSRHRHFGRAAEACSISQPALSVQIRELENEIGARLFERAARRISLTAIGEQFSERVSHILKSVDELTDLARASGGRLVGRLRLGVIPTIAPYLLPAVIRRITQKYDGLDLHIRETLTSRLIEDLSDGRIDAAIVALPISESAFVEVELFNEEFVLVRHLSDADRPAPDAETLRDLRLLLLEEGHCFREQAMSFCNLSSTLSRDGLDASSLSTLVQMVASGIGVTLIPEMAVPVETRSARVAVNRFDRNAPSRTVGMIWRKSNPLSSQLMELSATVREAGRALQTNTPGTP